MKLWEIENNDERICWVSNSVYTKSLDENFFIVWCRQSWRGLQVVVELTEWKIKKTLCEWLNECSYKKDCNLNAKLLEDWFYKKKTK